jgi:hypothetical protein
MHFSPPVAALLALGVGWTEPAFQIGSIIRVAIEVQAL